MFRPVALVVAVLLPLAASAGAYRWKDANGQVHYSEVPPQGVAAEPVAPPPPPASSPNQDSLNKALDQGIKERPEQEKNAAKAAEQQAQREQECRQAREQIAFLDSHTGRRRLASTDAQGNVTRATDEDYRQRRAEYEKVVADKCS